MHLNDWSTENNTKPRRRIPERTYKNYRQYKKWLREDFDYRCGYCEIHENDHGGNWHFHVDHYKPKSNSRFRHLETEYSNLLYSCDICNVYKGDSWPSDNPLNDGIGWLDPCEHNLKEHYYYGFVDKEFKLICETNVGRWMATMLTLDQPARISHRYNLVRMEQIYIEIVEYLYKQLKKLSSDDNSAEYAEIQNRINDIEDLLRAKRIPASVEPIQRNRNLYSSNEQEDHDVSNTHSITRK